VKRFTRRAGASRKGSEPKRAKRAGGSKRVKLSPGIRAYIRTTDGFRAGRDPIPLMKAAPARFARAASGLSSAKLRKRPGRGKWSIQEILGHLLDTEVIYAYRYRMMMGASGGPIQGYDQEQMVREMGWSRRRWSVKRILSHIAALRRSTLFVLQNVPRPYLKRYGMHSERGKETVRRTQEMIAGHDLNHLTQIKAIRKKYGW